MRMHLEQPRRAGASTASATRESARAYNDAGDGYLAYADGDPKQLYAFEGHLGYCDRRLWRHIDAVLLARRKTGATTLSVLDAGCGPGTWLRRVVERARALGYRDIAARGFDVAGEQVARARDLSADLAAEPGVRLSFEIGDLAEPLVERDGSVDLCLCLYGVLNHVPVDQVPRVLGEFARVTSGHTVVTVRAVGSTPSIFVGGLERARDFRLDRRTDWCVADLRDGRRISLYIHLYAAAEFRDVMRDAFEIIELRGLDLFHTRFSPDMRWNPPSAGSDGAFDRALHRLEEEFAHNPGFMDRATHLLVVGQPRRSSRVDKTGDLLDFPGRNQKMPPSGNAG